MSLLNSLGQKFSKYFLIGIFIFASYLRISNLDKIPVSLYYDEVDVGYQAYSLLKTGKDYFGNFLPLQVQSYQEFRTPFNIYATIPTVAIFGINAYGIRTPAVIFGMISIYIMYLLVGVIGKFDESLDKKYKYYVSIIAVVILAVNPWHIQYSRIPLEVTSFLTFFLLGLYLFFRSIEKPRFLKYSAVSFFLTPWIYSTAKFFTPIFILFLIILYFKKIKIFPKSEIIKTLFISAIFIIPLLISLFRGQAGSRFSYISVFTDPVTASEVDYQRQSDAIVDLSLQNTKSVSRIESYLIHNKLSFWGDRIVNNLIKSLSTEFLFIDGDSNLRHSPEGVGEFYKIEFVALIVGLILFYSKYSDKRIKTLITLWIILGMIPSAITRDGGAHATRLITILPPLVFLMSYGIVMAVKSLKPNILKNIFIAFYISVWVCEFIIYQHVYHYHYPWYSERSFSYGYKEVINYLKTVENSYEQIVFTNAAEDPKIFIAAYYPIDPIYWQKGLKKADIEGFGVLNGIDKYYFGQPQIPIQNAEFESTISSKLLYIASERELKSNLLTKPADIPQGLKLVKTFIYPSGEPVFYAFEKI